MPDVFIRLKEQPEGEWRWTVPRALVQLTYKYNDSHGKNRYRELPCFAVTTLRYYSCPEENELESMAIMRLGNGFLIDLDTVDLDTYEIMSEFQDDFDSDYLLVFVRKEEAYAFHK